jgi:hypothetical protein
MILLHRSAILGPIRRDLLVKQILSAGGQWAASEDLGRTGAGTIEQLAPGPSYASADMMMVRQIMASICYTQLSDTFSLPEPDLLEPQVFPVSMRGSDTKPPHQRPHIDNHRGIHPLVTSVYYAWVRDTRGGAIRIDLQDDHLIVEPKEDDLIAFPGNTLHSVEELYAGERLSIVCNFYQDAANE